MIIRNYDFLDFIDYILKILIVSISPVINDCIWYER